MRKAKDRRRRADDRRRSSESGPPKTEGGRRTTTGGPQTAHRCPPSLEDGERAAHVAVNESLGELAGALNVGRQRAAVAWQTGASSLPTAEGRGGSELRTDDKRAAC